jgi:hypothetical protein
MSSSQNMTFGDAQKARARARRAEAKGLFGSASTDYGMAAVAYANVGMRGESDACRMKSRECWRRVCAPVPVPALIAIKEARHA